MKNNILFALIYLCVSSCAQSPSNLLCNDDSILLEQKGDTLHIHTYQAHPLLKKRILEFRIKKQFLISTQRYTTAHMQFSLLDISTNKKIQTIWTDTIHGYDLKINAPYIEIQMLPHSSIDQSWTIYNIDKRQKLFQYTNTKGIIQPFKGSKKFIGFEASTEKNCLGIFHFFNGEKTSSVRINIRPPFNRSDFQLLVPDIRLISQDEKNHLVNDFKIITKNNHVDRVQVELLFLTGKDYTPQTIIIPIMNNSIDKNHILLDEQLFHIN